MDSLPKLISYPVEQCLSLPACEFAYNDLKPFYELLERLSHAACKYYFYEGLEVWSGHVYEYVRKMLDKYKFVSGGQFQNADAEFWFGIYKVVSDVCYSPNLKTKTSIHQSSAWERNEALKADIKILIDNLC